MTQKPQGPTIGGGERGRGDLNTWHFLELVITDLVQAPFEVPERHIMLTKVGGEKGRTN